MNASTIITPSYILYLCTFNYSVISFCNTVAYFPRGKLITVLALMQFRVYYWFGKHPLNIVTFTLLYVLPKITFPVYFVLTFFSKYIVASDSLYFLVMLTNYCVYISIPSGACKSLLSTGAGNR